MIFSVALVLGCVEPQPQTLTLPSISDRNREVRKAMLGFNEAQFKKECAAIDEVLLGIDLQLDTLAGNVRLVVDTNHRSGGLEGWNASAGQRVVWDWQAFSLDGQALAQGRDEFEVERGSVPQAFHEAAKHLGHKAKADVWSPSLSAFGIRGIPGQILPYTPVRLKVLQTRSAQDTSWIGGMHRGDCSEKVWLETALMSTVGQDDLMQLDQGVWCKVHREWEQSLEDGMSVLLKIHTATMTGSFERETQMEWSMGTPNQLVEALERALSAKPRSRTLTVWSISDCAFGTDGSPEIGIPSRTPLRFDVEILPLQELVLSKTN